MVTNGVGRKALPRPIEPTGGARRARSTSDRTGIDTGRQRPERRVPKFPVTWGRETLHGMRTKR